MNTIGDKRLMMVLLIACTTFVLMGALKGLGEDPTREELEQLRSRIVAAEAIVIPVGGIIPWYGAAEQIPANFEICDGSAPTTPGAVILAKPDLRDRFIKGTDMDETDVTDDETGGVAVLDYTEYETLTIDEIPAHSHTHSHTIDLQHDHNAWSPPHSHNFPIGDGDAGERDKAADGDKYTKNVSTNGIGVTVYVDPALSDDAPTSSDSTEAGGGEPGESQHRHTLNLDNQPPWFELFYLIRVK